MANVNKIVFYCAALEIVYLSLSFALSEYFGQWSVEGEAVRTGLRILVIIIYGYCYRRFFYERLQSAHLKTALTPPFLVAVGLLFLHAVMNTNAENESMTWQVMFAVSGITAGFREELFYRGLLQQRLQQLYGYKVALVVASAVFTLSHIHYIYHGQFYGLTLITLAGVIFGCIFIYTRSIIITSVIHGLYDAILSINISPIKINPNFAWVGLFLIMLLFLMTIYKKINLFVKGKRA